MRVESFRSIRSLAVDLPGFAILIGRNNAGKSNVLQALRFLLEATSKDLSDEDFYCGDAGRSERLSIEATVSGMDEVALGLLEEKHRGKVAACIDAGRIRIRRVATRLPGRDVGKMEIWEQAKSAWGTPTGIDAAFRQFLPEVILIEAFRDPSSEALGKATAALGRLLKQVVEPVKAQISAGLEKAISEAGRQVNTFEADGKEMDERPEELRRIEERVRRVVRELFASADMRFRFQLPGVPELLASATVELKDGGPWTPPDGKGQGFQRVLYFALLRAIAEELRGVSQKLHRPFLLLFEEPEAFLHPALQRQMGDTLTAIAAVNQVVVATHSPFLVTPDRLESVFVLRQPTQPGGKETTVAKATDVDGSPEEDKSLASLLKLHVSADWLFADVVLVVEGSSDRALLEACCHRRSTDAAEVGLTAIIEAGGKAVVPAWIRHLRSLGYRVRGVVDLDFIWNGAGSVLKDDQGLSRLCSWFWSAAEAKGLLEDGKRKIDSARKSEAFSMLLGAEGLPFRQELMNVVDRLQSDFDLWVLRQGEIESYFGLSHSSKGKYVEASREVRNGELKVDAEIDRLLDWAFAAVADRGGEVRVGTTGTLEN